MRDMMIAKNVMWQRPENGDYGPEIAALETQFDVVRYMKGVLHAFDFKTFIVFIIPLVSSEKLAANSIISNVPADLVARYDELNLLKHSPGAARLRETTAPFHMDWREWLDGVSQIEGAGEIERMLDERGLREAYYFPVHDADGNRGAVVWTGERPDVPMSEIMELQMIAIHIFNRLSEIGATLKSASVNLSEREKQCLTWTAAGKTSSEIADILGLSEHTVNHYLNQVTKKLDAVNRTQAVVKAMKRGLIA